MGNPRFEAAGKAHRVAIQIIEQRQASSRNFAAKMLGDSLEILGRPYWFLVPQPRQTRAGRRRCGRPRGAAIASTARSLALDTNVVLSF